MLCGEVTRIQRVAMVMNTHTEGKTRRGRPKEMDGQNRELNEYRCGE